VMSWAILVTVDKFMVFTSGTYFTLVIPYN